MDPSGIFATTYGRDSALVRTRAQWLALALFGAALLPYPWLASPRLVAVANLMLVTAIVVVGLQITTGYAGQINLGQAAFMGVGAYGASVVRGQGRPAVLGRACRSAACWRRWPAGPSA